MMLTGMWEDWVILFIVIKIYVYILAETNCSNFTVTGPIHKICSGCSEHIIKYFMMYFIQVTFNVLVLILCAQYCREKHSILCMLVLYASFLCTLSYSNNLLIMYYLSLHIEPYNICVLTKYRMHVSNSLLCCI